MPAHDGGTPGRGIGSKRPAEEEESHSEEGGSQTQVLGHTEHAGESAQHELHNPDSSAAHHHVEIRKDTPNDTIVPLSVGGVRFVTTLGTLRKYPDSFLGAMFSGRHSNLARDETGAVFLDRDPMLFGIVLQFLRYGKSTHTFLRSFAVDVCVNMRALRRAFIS